MLYDFMLGSKYIFLKKAAPGLEEIQKSPMKNKYN
jgi:hypothetical protein